MNTCTVCADFETKLQRAYEDLASRNIDSRRAEEEAQRKISRLLSAKHAHEAKQRCSQQGN